MGRPSGCTNRHHREMAKVVREKRQHVYLRERPQFRQLVFMITVANSTERSLTQGSPSEAYRSCGLKSAASGSVVVPKFCRSHSVHVRLGEFTDAVKRILQLPLIALNVFVAGFRWDNDESAEAHQHAGKRLGNHHAVPTIEHPGAV